MRTLTVLVALFLSACGDGGDTMPPPVAIGSVSGITYDGLIINGTVRVYDFSGGVKGALLAETVSDGNGLYSVSLQIESRPVMVEITGGFYTEEAGSNAQIALSAAHKLVALANYTTGSALRMSVTNFTHLAAGLAAFQIGKGVAAATAIENANRRVSNWTGVNILTTTPRPIIDATNASATLTPELRYGFAAGAISMWTYRNAPTPASAHLPPFTSIDFGQLLYQDVSADGLLDGFGRNSAGDLAQLSFGIVPLGIDVYRFGLGVSLVQMAAHTNNKTGIDGAKVLSFAQAYITNTDTMFNGVSPRPFAPAPVVNITSPTPSAWLSGVKTIAAAISPDSFGHSSADLLVDGVLITTSGNNTAPTFALATTNFTQGMHAVAVRATDLAGFTTTQSITLGVDNSYPTSSATIPYQFLGDNQPLVANGCASDGFSGLRSVRNTTHGIEGSLAASGCWSVSVLVKPGPYQDVIRVQDWAGNCSYYTGSAGGLNGQWGIVAQGPC